MNVYVWTNTMKNAYIWDVYEYSYDFRGKTISQVQADWWNIFEWLSAATINSYWISLTNGQELRAKIDKSWILKNAKKITMGMIATLNWYSASRFSYYKTATISTREWFTWPRYASSWYQTTIYSDSTTDSVSLSWTATMTTVLDLDNKTWITTSSKWYSRSWTLTDEQVSNIRNNTNWIYINVSVNWWIWYIYTLVEY